MPYRRARFSSHGKTVKLAPSTVLSLFFAVPNRESDDGHINQVHAPIRFTPCANADCASTSALLATAIIVAAALVKRPGIGLANIENPLFGDRFCYKIPKRADL
jgi:hypothetical protein